MTNRGMLKFISSIIAGGLLRDEAILLNRDSAMTFLEALSKE
jgi:hypothetical protein